MRRLANLIAHAVRPQPRNSNTANATPAAPAAEHGNAVSTTAKKTEPSDVDHYLPFLASRSPLTRTENAPAWATLEAIYRDPTVQRAAGECQRTLQRAVEQAGFQAHIHTIIEGLMRNGTLMTAASVAEGLHRHFEEIEDTFEKVIENRDAHRAAARRAFSKHDGLRVAVGALLNELVAERDQLSRADDAEKRANALGLPTRYRTLINAGMSHDQVLATEPDAASPEMAAAKRRQRLSDLMPMIQACRAFGESPNFDAALVAGLSAEIDAAIVERDGALPTEAA